MSPAGNSPSGAGLASTGCCPILNGCCRSATSPWHSAAASWQLADTSTNGTFLNRENDPIGAGDLRRLRDGDRVRVGAYEIEMRLVDEEIARPGPASRGGPFADPFSADPFSMDPFGPAERQRNPFDEPDRPSVSISAGSAQLPHDFDPLASELHETPFRGPTQADNSPAMQDAFHLPAQVGQMPLHAGGIIPGDDLLPDDWDKDLLEGMPHPATRDRPPRRLRRLSCARLPLRKPRRPNPSSRSRLRPATAKAGAGSGCR